MTWILVSRGFWRTPCGRFDKILVNVDHGRNYYTVIDWELGQKVKTYSVEEADSWAKDRAEKREPALTGHTLAG